MDNYTPPTNIHLKSDFTDLIMLDFSIDSIINNDINLTKLKLTPIPKGLNTPNEKYAKIVNISGMEGVGSPVVPLAPSPAPSPSPSSSAPAPSPS